VAGVAKKIILLILLAFPIAGLLTASGYAQQQNTNVNFELCGAESPELTITSPQSDSVTDQAEVVLSGTAANTTQIEVSLNGSFDQSIAIGQDTDSFNTSLTLQQGTNAILLTAYYSCNGTSSSTNLVITYQPGSKASTGEETSTESAVDDGEFLPTISNPQEKPDTPSQNLPERLAENLGLGADINESIVRPVASWAALIVSVGSTFIALSPMYFSAKLFDFLGLRRLSELGRGSRIVVRILLGIVSILLAIFVQA
jgi:hypothetical protein